jgi:type I restriction-modification system DNA methylase subunit
MNNTDVQNLRSVKNFAGLVDYLRDELDWPIEVNDVSLLTFEYDADELGIDPLYAARIETICQVRPLVDGQPWGIFYIEFETMKLPITVMRRILNRLVRKQRNRKVEQATWNLDDLLFVSAVGNENTDQREMTFAHFHQEQGDLPTLRVLGWDGADTVLKMEYVAQTLKQKLRWPQNPKDVDTWREQWTGAFIHKPGYVIKTANALAERLAELARGIRDAAQTLMAHETEKGHLRTLHKAFQTALIHDLSKEEFADTYAQTITYGLLTAAISRTETSAGKYGTALVAENVTDMVPITNPFLREMLQTFLHAGGGKDGIDFDELGIQDVVELLRGEETDLPAVLRDFGNRAPGEDPVIHFYEHFLSAYNKKLKIQRGVFYTPKPVVSYIVRSVHELLQKEFGLEDGLASSVTWGEMVKSNPEIKIPKGTSPDSPFVTILDPATGTATFLVEVIEVIHKTLTAKWKAQKMDDDAQQAKWNEYVPKHLLPRLYGYELMMAPYAIAHMKIGLKLHETGYHFGSDERVRIYLTNSLEEPSLLAEQSAASLFEALGHEAQAVNDVKRNMHFTVVIGNPPYSIQSANLDEASRNLVEPYKCVDGERIHERNALQFEKNLQDDYIKFIRLAELIINSAGIGFIGYISNDTFLDSRSFRGMRQSLILSFQKISILDLHGSQKKAEQNALGYRDENVFDIQQGVCISLLLQFERHPTITIIERSELVDTRTNKYDFLNSNSYLSSSFLPVKPLKPFYLFASYDINKQEEYAQLISLRDIVIKFSSGVKTHKDKFAYAFTQNEMESRMVQFKDATIPDAYFRSEYDLLDTPLWELSDARDKIRKKGSDILIINTLYRPFDFRAIAYSDDIVRYTAHTIMQNLDGNRNVALLVSQQQITEGFSHAFVTRIPADWGSVSNKSRESTSIFPLYINTLPSKKDAPSLFSLNEFQSNLKMQFNRTFRELLGDQSIKSEEIFNYIYAVLYSPSYRTRYASFLKSDFPQLPLTRNIKLFRDLCALGKELVALHLLEFETRSNDLSRFVHTHSATDVTTTVEKGYPKFVESKVHVNDRDYFAGVPNNVWEFHIGSYQVCEKWLKDRRGRQLSAEDIAHYQKIIVALKETIRLMGEVDAAIESAGGWPIK